jgi:hypothetical protein
MRPVGCVSPLRFAHGDGLGFNAGLVNFSLSPVLLGKSVRSLVRAPKKNAIVK